MGETKHTPAPWRQYIWENGERVIQNAVPPASAPIPQNDFDRALICAAPDLLAALKEVFEWIDNGKPVFTFDDDWPEVEARMTVAIAKAEGRSP